MLQAAQLDDLYQKLRSCDIEWLDETLQQRWSHLEATATNTPSDLMRGTKRARMPSIDMEPADHPHDLTAKTLAPGKLVSDHVMFLRAFDWASTRLGSMDSWSPTLRRSVNFVLADPRAAVIYWGEDRVMIYNAPYRDVLLGKHPYALGRTAKEVWPATQTLWDSFSKGEETGASSKGDHEQFFIDRRGFLEETYADWSIIPIAVPGTFAFYNIASEVTAQVHYQRQMEALLSLERHTLDVKKQSDFWQRLLSGLESNHHEFPFALLYSSQVSRRASVASVSVSDSIASSEDSRLDLMPWGLEGTVGIAADSEAVPFNMDSDQCSSMLSPMFKHAILSGTVQTLRLEDDTFSQPLRRLAKSRAHGDTCSMAVLIPIGRANDDHGPGFLLLGINSRRIYDSSYQSFIRLLHRQLESTLVAVRVAEDEDRRVRMSAERAALERARLSEQLEITVQESKDNERRFRTTAENIPIAMYELSTDGDILYANSAYYDLTGIDPNKLYPYCWVDTIDESQRAVYDAQFEKLANGEAVRFESKLKKPWEAEDLLRGEHINSETWVLSAAYALRNPDGSIRSLQGALLDISRQKWMERFQVQQAIEQDRRLQEAIELKRQQERFMDMVGHEVRNPLSAITLCASSIMENLEQALDASQTGEIVLKRADVVSHIENSDIITTCISHQRRIIDDVLTLSKLDSGLLAVAPCEIQPRALVEQSLRMCAGETQQSDINLQYSVDNSYTSEKVDWVLLDPSRLLQVLLNLINNSIKFTRNEAKRDVSVRLGASAQLPNRSPQGTVYLDFPTPEDKGLDAEGTDDVVYIMFSVKDTGCGINADELEKIFLRFQQSSPKTHVTYGGSGLGLFISRELARLQGGRMGVASTYGKGSTFEFYVRAKRCGPPPSPTYQSNPRRLSIRRKNTAVREGVALQESGASYAILLVEDNLVNQRVVSKRLQDAGHRVSLANHGGEALDFILRSQFCKSDGVALDVILMDIEMPVMGGLEATRRIRTSEAAGEISGSIPIIAVTANARGEQCDDARDAGVNAVVTKPFQMQELLREVEAVLPRIEETEEAKRETGP